MQLTRVFGIVAAVALVLGVSAGAGRAQEKRADNTPPEGFVAVFNGKDLSGWKGLLDPKKKLDNPVNRAKLSPAELKVAQAEADENMRAHWKVADGALVFDGKGRSLCTARD